MGKQYIFPPKEGWKKNSWYLVAISFNCQNPIYRALFFTGFIHEGKPGSYNMIADPTSDSPLSLKDIYYLRAIRLVVTEKHLDKLCEPFIFKGKEEA